MSLNNFKGVSNKVRKISLLTSHVIDKIDENQKIKRLLVYNTINPLSLKGKEFDGDIVDQPDITKSLYYEESKDNPSYIISGTFDIDTKDDFENSLYIHCYNGTFNDITGRLKIAINILIPKQFEFLASKGDTRTGLIAQEIANLFDNIYLDNDNCEVINELGNLKFELVGYESGRLSKTNTMILTTLVFNVDITTMRLEGGY